MPKSNIFTYGPILTMDEKNSTVEAVGVIGKRALSDKLDGFAVDPYFW